MSLSMLITVISMLVLQSVITNYSVWYVLSYAGGNGIGALLAMKLNKILKRSK